MPGREQEGSRKGGGKEVVVKCLWGQGGTEGSGWEVGGKQVGLRGIFPIDK